MMFLNFFFKLIFIKDDDSKSKNLFSDYIDESQSQIKPNSVTEFSSFTDTMRNIEEPDDFEEDEAEDGPSETNPNSETQFNYVVDYSSTAANTADGKLVNTIEYEAINEEKNLAPLLANNEDDDDDEWHRERSN